MEILLLSKSYKKVQHTTHISCPLNSVVFYDDFGIIAAAPEDQYFEYWMKINAILLHLRFKRRHLGESASVR